MKTRRTAEGFTLIELLVVIAIIGMLASVVLASLNSARTKGQIARANTDLGELRKAIVIAQGESGIPLRQITGSNCTRCTCNSLSDLRNVSSSHACYTGWIESLGEIETATGGVVSGIDRITRDPWGSPYILDENEGENPSNYCNNDTISSVGPDGVLGNSDDITYTVPTLAICE